VYLVRRGGEFREYQSDVPLTFVHRGGYSKDRVAKVTGMAEYLSRLERPSLKKEGLGTRFEQGRQMYGLRFSEGQVVEEWWIDEQTDLPRRLLRTSRQTGETQLEINITADEPPPAAIVNYEPPATKEMRYGGRQDETALAWRRHVEELGAQLEAEPPAGPVAIVPRENGLTFSVQWPLRTPDGRRWIAPLDVSQDTPMTMAYLVKFRLSEGSGERRDGAWRLAKGLHDVKIPRADLVYEDGTPWREWAAYVLDRHGLELVDEEQPRTIWVAKHDGRQFKPWREVKPPVPYIVEGGVEKKGVVRPGVGYILRPVTLTGSSGLLEEFNRMIDRNDLAADKPWIVDETGLPTPPTFDKAKHATWEEYWRQEIEGKHAAATDAPYFVGNESLEMARQWYEKEFGVTFEERTETQTVHVIRRKQ
jgi:hypothetical protein